MVLDLLVLHRNAYALRWDASELISLSELKSALLACLANEAEVTLRIHVARRIDRKDIRAVSLGLFVVVAYGWLEKSWLVTVDRL